MNAPNPLATVEGLIAAGRIPEADRLCQEVLQRDPRNPIARYLFARTRFNLSRFQDARNHCESLVREHPTMFPAHYLLAQILQATGLMREAARSWGEAIAGEYSLAPASDWPSRLETVLDFIVRAPLAQVDQEARKKVYQAYGAALDQAGREPPGPEWFARVAQLPLARAPLGEFRTRFAIVQSLLGVSATAPRAWMQPVFESVLLPWMRMALAADRFDNALDIEHAIYGGHVKAIETEEHFRECFAHWTDDMRAGGKRFAASLPATPRGPGGKRPRIAFFVYNLTMLAHVKTLLEVLQGHAELPEPLFDAYVFCQWDMKGVVEQFEHAGVRTQALVFDAGEGTTTVLQRLQKRIAEEGIDVLVWISLALAMPFAFAMRLAPRQVWWAMKYHALAFDEIDEYLTGGGDVGTTTLHGRTWRVGPVVAGEWFAPELAPQAASVRKGLGPADLVFGTFGREEKLDNPAYLGAVVEILRACPAARFLWTGRARSSRVQEHLEAAGVADRTSFIGWVDTKLYAQVIDIFLDSFPFPCGYTLYEAMAAGKPAVLFASRETSHGGINAIVGPLLAADPASSDEARLTHSLFAPGEGQSLYLRASTPQEYVGHAVALARDPALRERAGKANRSFIEGVMTDRKRAARIYADHLLGRDPAPAA